MYSRHEREEAARERKTMRRAKEEMEEKAKEVQLGKYKTYGGVNYKSLTPTSPLLSPS